MSEKELLYLEDAVKHENNIIGMLFESTALVEDEELVSFLGDEIKIHSKFVNKLMDFLGGKANE